MEDSASPGASEECVIEVNGKLIAQHNNITCFILSSIAMFRMEAKVSWGHLVIKHESFTQPFLPPLISPDKFFYQVNILST